MADPADFANVPPSQPNAYGPGQPVSAEEFARWVRLGGWAPKGWESQSGPPRPLKPAGD